MKRKESIPLLYVITSDPFVLDHPPILEPFRTPYTRKPLTAIIFPPPASQPVVRIVAQLFSNAQ